MALRYAPRWWQTTPFGSPVVPRGVAEADRLPFVLREAVFELWRAFGDERLVVLLAEPLPAVAHRIVDVDHQGRGVHSVEGARDHRRELAVGDQHLRPGVAEDEADGVRVEPVVERVEHRAAHRHAEVGFEHLRDVRGHQRDGVADADPASGEGAGEAAAARVELGVGVAPITVDDRRLGRVDHRRSLQEADWREWHEVRGLLVEPVFVGVGGRGHRSSLGQGGDGHSL